MPSYRYTRDIPPEKLVPEAPPEYTKKEKAKNWWHYHWKWLLAGLVLVVILAAFIVAQLRIVRPDLSVGVVTPYTLPAELTEALEARLAGIAGDLNGDGKAAARVEVFTIDFSGDEDISQQMAGVTKLMAAFETGEITIFLADPSQVDSYQEYYGLFGTPEGGFVENGDPAEITMAFSALAALNAEPIDLPYIMEDGTGTVDGRDLLADYRVGMRALYGTKLKDDEAFSETWHRERAIFEALKTGG